MVKKRNFYLVVVIMLCPITLFGQMDMTRFKDNYFIEESDSNKVYLNIKNTNYFRNNEFFNDLDEGFTTFASLINATVKYYPSSRSKLETGIHLVNYYGRDKFDKVRPIIRFQYRLTKNLNFVIGSLYGTVNHDFIEPVFRQERYIDNNIESGVQMLYDSKYIHSDLYLNWEKYIFRTSLKDKEVFTVGWTNEFRLFKKERRLKVNIPVQFLTAHIGGQVDTLSQPLESLTNFVLGAHVGYKFDGLVNEIGAKIYAVHYKDISDIPKRKFRKGNAFYPIIYGKSKYLNVYAGYWNANSFIVPRGEPIFGSASVIKNISLPNRELFIFKAELFYEFSKGANIGARYETYYNLHGGKYDMSYGCYINLNRDFFLKTVKIFK